MTTTTTIRLHEVSVPGITAIWSQLDAWDLVAGPGAGELFIEHRWDSACPTVLGKQERWAFEEARPHVPPEVW